MAITNYHRDVFEYLEAYRAEHPEAGLTYSLRQKNGKDRPRNRYLFTGNDKYISIGLYDPVSNNNKTRTISVYMEYDPVADALKNCILAIVFSDEKLEGQVPTYREIIRQIGQDRFLEYSHNRFELEYPGSDWRVNLQTYLEEHKPIIDRVIQQAGVTALFNIPTANLEAAIEVANQPTPAEVSDDTNYWVFQGNLAQYRIVDALKDGALKTWRVAAHAQRISPGDKVILWITGSEGGCYALAEVNSDVYTGPQEPEEAKYQVTGDDTEMIPRVKLTITDNLWNEPATKAELAANPAFSDFKGGNQGTNFTATQVQYQAILEIIASRGDEIIRSNKPGVRNYWKYSPGKQNSRWENDQQDQVMAISFTDYNTGPLDQFNSQADLDTHLGLPDHPNQTRNLYEFMASAIGDVVFADAGTDKVVGIGIITGPYQYRANDAFPHYRSVQWLATQPWTYTAYQIARYPKLFKNDIFSRSKIWADIIRLYVGQYPQYRPVFEQHGLLQPEQNHSYQQPMSTLYSKNIILYGPPGTGKTYGTIDLAVDIVDGRKSPDHKVNKPRFDQLRQEGQIEFITFHQNYTYEDFVTGLKPDVDNGSLTFQRSYGIFYKVAKRARDNYEASIATGLATVTVKPFQEVFDAFMKPLVEAGTEIEVTMASGIQFVLFDLSERSISYRKANGSTLHTLSIATLKQIYDGEQEISPNGLKPYYKPLSEALTRLGRQTRQNVPLKNYVLIIDEINRANMSRVFGELITLLEEDKRLGADNELTVTLPSGEPFAVPPNLYLVGTMNTADKSLALLDIALRRRFEFIGQYPDYSLLQGQARAILEGLNRAILMHKKSADFQIGHAYFINKADHELTAVLNNRVIPLLLEYFNGRADMVVKILEEAGVTAVLNEHTHQLQAEV